MTDTGEVRDSRNSGFLQYSCHKALSEFSRRATCPIGYADERRVELLEFVNRGKKPFRGLFRFGRKELKRDGRVFSTENVGYLHLFREFRSLQSWSLYELANCVKLLADLAV